MDIIKLEKLSKHFGDVKAVDDVSFIVREGEVFGFLGPNGAGKTTTLSMLSTLLPTTSGQAFINGFNINTQQDEVRNSIGIVFQDPSLDDELTAYENMDFHGRLYRVPKAERQRRIAELLALVGLADRKDALVKTFSGGMKRRLEIARGLVHHPKVLFLDEPTTGLDPQTRNHLWDYIRKLSKEKDITIILTTHYMDEADKLCDRVAIIDHGKIIAIDAPENLKSRIGGDVISVQTTDGARLHALIKNHPWFKSAKEHDSQLTIHLKDAEKHVAKLVSIADAHKIKIESLSIHKPTLEDVFLHFTGKTIREQEASVTENMRLRRRVFGRR